jgi:hypothetical protein
MVTEKAVVQAIEGSKNRLLLSRSADLQVNESRIQAELMILMEYCFYVGYTELGHQLLHQLGLEDRMLLEEPGE